MSARELEGKVALVTGGARGIGREIALSLADAGARIAIIDVIADSAKATADELPGEGHAGFICDVVDSGQVQSTVEEVEESVGPIHVLVNNAGITRDNLIMRMKDEEFDQVIAVNLKGPFNFIKSTSRGMMKRREGAIVNIASVVGLMGNAGQANYAASKAGLIGLTKTVAREFASRGVRCNAIAPGFIQTAMTDALNEAQRAELQARIPLGELGTAADVAGAVRFLVGPAARYITGQVLTVDGGMVM
jgi:3-oxoacyl-[acyl-carrier protein] reductase